MLTHCITTLPVLLHTIIFLIEKCQPIEKYVVHFCTKFSQNLCFFLHNYKNNKVNKLALKGLGHNALKKY